MIEAVTAADIKNFMARVLSTKPSLALVGEGAETLTDSYESLLQRLEGVSSYNQGSNLQMMLWVWRGRLTPSRFQAFRRCSGSH
eukprot:1153006-Pelagomonas_calceolata.AAC.4